MAPLSARAFTTSDDGDRLEQADRGHSLGEDRPPLPMVGGCTRATMTASGQSAALASGATVAPACS